MTIEKCFFGLMNCSLFIFVCLALAGAVKNCICMYIHFIDFISKVIVFGFCFSEQYFGLVYPLVLIGREQGQ